MELSQDSGPIVPFVGAGASCPPPSNLPTWNGFNLLLLECLCERLAEFSGGQQPTDEILSRLNARRNETKFFRPDFQAQLMEEEVGPAYFSVWQSLDTTAFGPAHAHLAQLAAEGRVAAIITTNFDRLIELALDARAQPYRVFHNEASFNAFAAAGDCADGPLPIIKIHGSVEDPASLVDTLRQRVVGRPPALQTILDRLLREHIWVFLGFSGADFNYNHNYLNILNSAPEARGFCFVARDGDKVEDGVERLSQAYGKKASIVRGYLAEWLRSTFALPAEGTLYASGIDQKDADRQVKRRIAQWVESLGSLSVVNILYSMLKSAGLENDAFWLMRRTFKIYRTPADTRSKSYSRYNYNYGLSLVEAGLFSGDLDQADEDAFQFLARGYDSGGILDAGARLGSIRAYRGQIDKARAMIAHVANIALAGEPGFDFCDIVISSADLFDIIQVFRPAIARFRQSLEIVAHLGDEVRRAQLCVPMGRFLTYAKLYDEADGFLAEADRIGQRLDLRPTLMACKAARGLWLSDSGASVSEGLRMLKETVNEIRAIEAEPLFVSYSLLDEKLRPKYTMRRLPLHCRVLLDCNDAARLAGDESAIKGTLAALDDLMDTFPGYVPHFDFAWAQCLLTHSVGEGSRIHDLIGEGRRIGALQGNPWAAQMAGLLDRELEKYRSAQDH
jgi:SIR2-like domain